VDDAKGEVCIGCGKQSPKTETNYTLISPRYGWRLSRERRADGTFEVEWRCPECWRDHRGSTLPTSGPVSGPVSSQKPKKA
jgi:hypothetical protein